jgi:hypothetical protein
LNDLFPHHVILAKSTDDDDPQTPKQRRRGHAGTAILWKIELDPLITPINEGSHRIIALEIEDHSPILLLNTYMPTLGAADADYQESLDEVFAITQKYDTHTMIWTGDINASTTRMKNNTNDLLFQKFCTELGLAVSDNMPDCPTFHHFNGRSSSRIDLFITKLREDPISSIEVRSRDPTNTGPHDPVIASIKVSAQVQEVRPTTEEASRPKIRWSKVDIPLYETATDMKLNALAPNVESLPATVVIQRLNSILYESAISAAPSIPKKKKKETKFRWTANLKPLVKESVTLHRRLKTTPPGDAFNKLKETLKLTKRRIRQLQNQTAASRRRDIHLEIIKACKEKETVFYQKIKAQRQPLKCPSSIDFAQHEEKSEQESWASYFQTLASPSTNDSYDHQYLRYLQTNHLLQSLISNGNAMPTVTTAEVEQYIKSLKNNKAADIFGITSEHLKYASSSVITILVHLLNAMIVSGKIPDLLKMGKVCPVLKKNKSSKNPTNYRRITITSIVGKILEKHMLLHTKKILDKAQSDCQFGFTTKCSPVYAAIALTEVMAESSDNGSELHLAFMDTSKAFDVVHHNGLLNSIYVQGVNGGLWNLYDNLYQEIKSVVLWKGQQSSAFPECQGIRQGGITSADLYKAGKNELLKILDHKTVCRIGHVNTGALMVADDLVIAADCPSELQLGVSIAALDSQRQRYSFNTQKTKVVSLNSKGDPSCSLITKPIATSSCEVHLGISRSNKCNNKDTIRARISSARRAMYSLMGAGLHGLNGVGPEVAIEQYNTYVLPTLLYGLEALHLSDRDVEELSKFHRSNLRCIQHLPKSTAIPAIHLLSGSPPIVALLHMRILSVFRDIATCTEQTPPAFHLKQLLQRQLAMKDPNSGSWTTQLKRVTALYQLPSAGEIIKQQPQKRPWSARVKSAVLNHWTASLRDDAQRMTTLAYLKLDCCHLGKMHHTWHALHNKLVIRKASVKSKLLVQRYPLTTSHTAGMKKAPLCILCHQDEETTLHFILHCPTLQQARHQYLPLIMDITRKYRINIDPTNIVPIILDVNHLPSEVSTSDRSYLETTSRDLLFKLHDRRSILLGGASAYKRALDH